MEMALSYQTPGVYREEEFLKPEALLPTGIPGFVGLAKSRLDSNDMALSPNSLPVALHHQDDFGIYFENADGSYLAEAIRGFFLNGGIRCYVVVIDTKGVQKFKDAIESLATLNDLDLLAIPDAINLPQDQAVELQTWVLKHCEELGDRFVILDVPQDLSAMTHHDELERQFTLHQVTGANGALYFPWIKVMTTGSEERLIPPCGHIAGIFARNDNSTGTFKAPANQEILEIYDLASDISHADQQQLNPYGINCIRAFPGRGIRVWGARTLSADAQWRYINVSRLFITVRRWIDANMSWAVFEPNTPRLWSQITRELDNYLHDLWLLGALLGNSPEQAYFVKCDAETNDPNNPNDVVMTEIGLAPSTPAEFVVIHIVHRQPATFGAGGD
jgi:uncharacterized protein